MNCPVNFFLSIQPIHTVFRHMETLYFSTGVFLRNGLFAVFFSGLSLLGFIMEGEAFELYAKVVRATILVLFVSLAIAFCSLNWS